MSPAVPPPSLNDLAAALAARLCDNAFLTLPPNPRPASASLGMSISLTPSHDTKVKKIQTAESLMRFRVGVSISRRA